MATTSSRDGNIVGVVWRSTSAGGEAVVDDDTPLAFQGLGSLSGSKSNVWYYLGATATTANNLGNSACIAMPVFIPAAKTLDRIGCEVTVAGEAGSTIRLGIYNDDGSGYPGSLLLDAGTIDATSATVQQITISQAVSPGLYWFCAAVQGAPTTQPTVRTVSAVTGVIGQSPGGSAATPTSNTFGVSQTSSGAFGASFNTTVTRAGQCARIFWRFA